MESLVSLEGYDPELRDYLQRHRWPGVMEALLTGLTVMTPRDPWQFVSQSLQHIQQTSITAIPRDIFVDSVSRGLLQRSPLRALLPDSDRIDEEQLERVYQFRGINLCRWCFKAWLEFHDMEQAELALHRQKMKQAIHHYNTVVYNKLLHAWTEYSHRKRFRRLQACRLLTRMHQRRLLWRLLIVWRRVSREVKQTRDFFEQQREMEAMEGGGWTWPEGNDPISLMERAVNIKIFSCVGVRGLVWSGQVCRSWKAITEDPDLWNRMDFFPFGSSLRDSGLTRQLHAHRPVLGHLSVRGCCNLSPDSLKIIGECHNLQDLNLSECDITDDVMDVIARSCSGLLYLNLSYCYVTDSTIRILTSRCTNLNHLSLAYCLHFTSKGLRSIQHGKGCRRLVYLDLSGCSKLTAEGLQYVGTGCPILNTVILDDIPTITDTMITSLASSCHNLRHVSILGGSAFSDRSVRALAHHSKKLRTLKIENNSVVTDTSLRVLGRGCRDLQLLHLAGCSRLSDKGLVELKRLKRLQVLNIADCTRVSDLGVRHIMEGASSSVLRELNLTNCQKLSDISLLRLTPGCPALTHLSLSYCEHISDTGVELLGKLPHLYSLDLTGCGITDHGVASLHNNPRLRHLGLAELPDITDDGIKRMCCELALLESLDISECELISSLALQAIAYHCHLLTRLYLTNCYKVTDDGVKYLCKGCVYLTHLDLSGCVITDKSLRLLRKGCQQLHYLTILCCVSVTRDEVQRYRKHGRVHISYNTDRPNYLNQSQDIPGLTDLETEPLINRL
jgi:F-box/leucine-rich repeat protein 13